MRIETLIWVFLWVASAASQNMPRRIEIKTMSRQLQQGQAKIGGGQEAPINAFPYHVALRAWDKATWVNGALITDKWIVTTAYVANNWLPETNGIALLGAHEPNITEVTQQKMEIEEKIVHESYKDGIYVNNVAVLRLRTAAQLDRFVSTVLLVPFNAPDFDGARLVMTGFSNTRDSQSKSLRYVGVDGISNSVCKRMHSPVNDGTLCVKTTGGIGGCSLDHGAPLVDVEKGLLVGLMVDGFACLTPPYPDVFVRVSYHYKWIMDKIKQRQ